MSNVVELHGDALDSIKRTLDRLVREGASHVALVVTYPGGQQVVLRSSNLEDASYQKVAGFQ